MAKKRYANVVDMMRDLAEDRTFADELNSHLARRRLVTDLIALRAARGLAQKEIAEVIGCTQGRISKLESSDDADLNLGTLVSYADALGFKLEITLVGKDVTLVDRVKHHAFRIKHLTDRMARLGSKDERIADGVADFLKEAAYNLVRLVKSSARFLPAPSPEPAPPISVDFYEAGELEQGDEETCSCEQEMAGR